LKKALFYLLMFLLAAAVPLIVAEAALRLWLGNGMTEAELARRLEQSRRTSLAETGGKIGLFGLVQASAHPDVVYELKPDVRGTFRDQPFATNSWGLRDDDLERDKPPGTVRIVGLGDSHMFGWGVGQGETYLDLLESRLNERPAAPRRRFEALNCAAPGYNTTMEVALYEHKCRAFAPDLVVLGFVGNDFGLPHFMQPPRGPSPRSWYVATVVKTAWSILFPPPERPEDADLLPHDRSDLSEDLRRASQSQYRHMLGEEAFRRALARLAALTSPDSVPVVVLTLGQAGDDRRLAAEVAAEHGFRLLNAAPRFNQYLVENGIEADRKAWRAAFQIADDGHPSALAHRLYAEVLFDEVSAIFTKSGG
jgi:hypothetical protein